MCATWEAVTVVVSLGKGCFPRACMFMDTRLFVVLGAGGTPMDIIMLVARLATTQT